MPLQQIGLVLSVVTPGIRWRMGGAIRPVRIIIGNGAVNTKPQLDLSTAKGPAGTGRTRANSATGWSLGGALRARAAWARPRAGAPRRTWAVLGEMGELGEESREQHDAIGRLAVRLDISRLVAVGDGAVMIHQGAAQEGSWNEESVWVADQAAALELLRRELAAGDVVLVKASRFVGLDRLASQLLIDAMDSSEATR